MGKAAAQLYIGLVRANEVHFTCGFEQTSRRMTCCFAEFSQQYAKQKEQEPAQECLLLLYGLLEASASTTRSGFGKWNGEFGRDSGTTMEGVKLLQYGLFYV